MSINWITLFQRIVSKAVGIQNRIDINQPPPIVFWTPAEITTAFWLDAADANNITVSSGKVSQWSDKSGNSRHATQGTADNQPAYVTGALNGLPVLSFDGSNDEMAIANMTDVTNFAFHVVLTITNTGDNGAVLTICNGDAHPNDPRRVRMLQMYTTLQFGASGSAGDAISPDTTQDEYNLFQWRQESGVTYRFNGDESAGIVYPASQSNGPKYALGSDGYARGWFNIAEIVATPTFSSGNTEKIEGYLAWKWGLEDNLPVDHPYKTHRPRSDW